MCDDSSLIQHGITAVGGFRRFQRRFEGRDYRMSAGLQADLAAWFTLAHTTGSLDPETVEKGCDLLDRLDDEVAALGGPYEQIVEDERFVTCGTYEGERLGAVARSGWTYLGNAYHVIHAIEAECAIADIRRKRVSA